VKCLSHHYSNFTIERLLEDDRRPKKKKASSGSRQRGNGTAHQRGGAVNRVGAVHKANGVSHSKASDAVNNNDGMTTTAAANSLSFLLPIEWQNALKTLAQAEALLQWPCSAESNGSCNNDRDNNRSRQTQSGEKEDAANNTSNKNGHHQQQEQKQPRQEECFRPFCKVYNFGH
jgi:hypothetical protein